MGTRESGKRERESGERERDVRERGERERERERESQPVNRTTSHSLGCVCLDRTGKVNP